MESSDDATTRVITGYEVSRFGVPMIGKYVNTGRGRLVTISPAVAGAQYRITAWAFHNGRRSATPAVKSARTTGKSERRSSQSALAACSELKKCIIIACTCSETI